MTLDPAHPNYPVQNHSFEEVHLIWKAWELSVGIVTVSQRPNSVYASTVVSSAGNQSFHALLLPVPGSGDYGGRSWRDFLLTKQEK